MNDSMPYYRFSYYINDISIVTVLNSNVIIAFLTVL